MTKVVEISRETWGRGQTVGMPGKNQEDLVESYLFQTLDVEDSIGEWYEVIAMCCKGFVAEQYGVDRYTLEHRPDFGSLAEDGILPDELKVFVYFDEESKFWNNTADGSRLMEINDTPIGSAVLDPDDSEYSYGDPCNKMITVESEENREELLTKIFARNGITVKFVD